MPIVVLGLSHHTAPVTMRERFAFTESQVPEALRQLREEGVVEEGVILSTCNRVEVYAAVSQRPEEALLALRHFLTRFHQFEGTLEGEIYALREPDSVEHLFKVACGMDSMVLGETEILGQLKKAYDLALTHKHTAGRLNKTFQRAFNVAKQIRTETNIQRGSISIGSVAVELAEKIFQSLDERNVMVIGAGDTSEKTARALLSRGAKSIIVSNRSFDRAEALALQLGGRAIHFEEWAKEFASIDIIISSTSAPHYVLDRQKLTPLLKLRRGRSLLLVDIAVPRDIEPEVNLMEDVYLFNIDDLQQIADGYLKQRHEEVSRCGQIIRRQGLGPDRFLASKGTNPIQPFGRVGRTFRSCARMKPVIIATRGSALALAQSNWTLEALRRAHPTCVFELLTIRTTGDKLQNASLTDSGGTLPRGLFTKELEAALLSGEADLAVHSLKDLPTELPVGLAFVASPAREDARDVLVTRAPGLSLSRLPAGGMVGTSSTRRQAQIVAARPDLRVEPIRGNVGTRLRKIASQPELSGTVLALAGLSRLGIEIGADGRLKGADVPEGIYGVILGLEEMLPAVGQAALGFETRKEDASTINLLTPLNHEATWRAVTAERAFLRSMGGGCLSPIAAYAKVEGSGMTIQAVSFLDGAARKASIKGEAGEAVRLGEDLAVCFQTTPGGVATKNLS